MADLSPKQVAALLGCDYQTVLDMIKDGSLPAYTIGKGRTYRVRPEDVEKLRVGERD